MEICHDLSSQPAKQLVPGCPPAFAELSREWNHSHFARSNALRCARNERPSGQIRRLERSPSCGRQKRDNTSAMKMLHQISAWVVVVALGTYSHNISCLWKACAYNCKIWQFKNLACSKKGVVYKLYTGWFINGTPGDFINRGLFIKFKGLLCGNPRKKQKFNTKFLAAKQFISHTQAPWLSAASEGLQDRKTYNTSNIYSVKR